MARSGSDWDDGMTTRELMEVARGGQLDSKSESERLELQFELCDRLKMDYLAPDGSTYEHTRGD